MQLNGKKIERIQISLFRKERKNKMADDFKSKVKETHSIYDEISTKRERKTKR